MEGFHMTNKEILTAIVDTVKSEMRRQNLSQSDLANRCTEKVKAKDPKGKGISQSSISNMFNRPSSLSLSNLMKICDGLDLSLFAIFRSINNSLVSNNTHLIYDISNPVFKGYISESTKYIYFLSTENSDSDELVCAELELGDFYHTNECIVRLKINIHQNDDTSTNPNYKEYEGNMVIYPNVSIFIHLVSSNVGDTWSLIFNHGDLNDKNLACALGCGVTLAAGRSHRYPTIHFAFLSSQKLSPKSEDTIKNLLRLHNEHIIISARNLDLFLKNENVDEAFKNRLRSIISETTYTHSQQHDADAYTISIKSIEAIPSMRDKNKYEAISRLLRYSSNPSSYIIGSEEDRKLHDLLFRQE